MAARFIRLTETARQPVTIFIDDQPATALLGDTVIVALLTATDHVRHSEFGDGTRAGFCLMGACQDCWVWTATGERLRACTTPLREGMRISTRQPDLHGRA